MRLLLDTNVVLDVLLQRPRHFEASSAVWAMVESGAVKASVSAHAVTTIHYLTHQGLGKARAMQVIDGILTVFSVAAVDRKVIDHARRLPMKDFEDAVTAAAAMADRCDFIVSRDLRGFAQSPVNCITPEAAMVALS